ncbi:hypothetical protein DW954_01885 [Clostridium sp. AM45-5]|nr:hypothetical protein [Clostridium sp. AM45-5]RHS68113.1 hypothetical protein DW954_01885 [Clostridium sp. AM45-5]
MAKVSQLWYCKKCGRVLDELARYTECTCDICNSKMYKVPDKYTEGFRWRDGDGKEALVEECVKTSSEFDPELFERRPAIQKHNNEEYERSQAIGRAIMAGADPKQALKAGSQMQNPQGEIPLPKCPYCGSLKVRKISTGKRMFSIGLFGLGSSKIGKQWHCNECNSDF